MSEQTSCGGVIRGDEGEWILGFSRKIQGGDVLAVEEWGFLGGLEAYWRMGLRRIEAESDASDLVNIIQTQEYKEYKVEPWLSIRSMMEKD